MPIIRKILIIKCQIQKMYVLLICIILVKIGCEIY